MQQPWQIWIDTGGTFTDCMAVSPLGEIRKCKVLSNSALRGTIRSHTDQNKKHLPINAHWQAPDHFIRGFQFRVLKSEHHTEFHPDFGGIGVKVAGYDALKMEIELEEPIDEDIAQGDTFEVVSPYEAPVLAARLVTETGPGSSLPDLQMRLATTKGTNALLERKGVPVALFVTKGFRDLLLIGNQQRPDLFALSVHKPEPLYTSVHEVMERIDALGKEIVPLDISHLKDLARKPADDGIRSAAVCLMNSYRNNKHEQQVAKELRRAGFRHISISSELSPFIKVLLRAETAVVNASLSPVIDRYLEEVYRNITGGSLFIMTSAGGLVNQSSYNAKDSLLSGPAGGVVGASQSARSSGCKKIISFDMGGTSTDVSRYDGAFDYRFEHTVGNAHLAAPALSIETVAAGGGSICNFDGYKLTVGPESAGADPGPACYGAGGPLTLTDVNLLLGHLDPARFGIPIDLRASEDCIEAIIRKVSKKEGRKVDRKEILSGFLEIANERMADAIRSISLRKGYDPSEYTLVAFGGAGGQHACGVAAKLNISTILLPADAGLLSAYGLGQALIERFAEQQVLQTLEQFEKSAKNLFTRLEQTATEKVCSEGISKDEIIIRRIIVNMRLMGQESSLSIDLNSRDISLLRELFKKRYLEIYGHWVERTIEVVSVRVVASTIPPEADHEPPRTGNTYAPDPDHRIQSTFGDQSMEAPVFYRDDLRPGAVINAPALVLDRYSTTVVDLGWELKIDPSHALILKRKRNKKKKRIRRGGPEAVNLELFTNRLTAIATEMGEMLRRTALSVNVKERLDFSCAVLDPDGFLVVNAPHIPVHLGALGLCVREVQRHLLLNPGDVIITNHPAYGGSHLPDITLITPVFSRGNQQGQLLGYVASRAHHAEVGGIRPGSMPPQARTLEEEGVVIPPVKLIDGGNSRLEFIRDMFLSAKYPSRKIEDNMADLNAMLAANRRGEESLRNLCTMEGTGRVNYYMGQLTKAAEEQMRSTLRQIPNGVYKALEELDDKTPLQVTVHIHNDKAIIDFTGTGSRHPGNLNATPAIVNSVIIYVLRLLVDKPLPLNEGLLKPVTIHLPENSLLNPGFPDEPAQCPAVVGGNTEVSQRLVDTLLKAFSDGIHSDYHIACSQGTMNNVLFGNDHISYYETVCGGTGAGPGFDGVDAVHHHMTNTRITDAEIIEHRYPVRVDRFEIRRNSGGAGFHHGGNGVIRELTFLESVSLSVLTQHRTVAPYGLNGGDPGQSGEQYITRNDGSRYNLKSIDGYELAPGDRFILKTPGGGGYGKQKI